MLTNVAPRRVLAGLVLGGAFLAIYLPDIGHGFISDDFRWIREGQFSTAADVVRIFQSNIGFYRPLVSLTFGVDAHLWGGQAFGYAVTNLLLWAMNALLLFVLARRLRLSSAAALVTTAVWALNFHAISMALLWLSGRTSLLAGAFGLAATLCVVSRDEDQPRFRSWVLAGVLSLLAMLCKEDAVVLPFFFMAWIGLTRSHEPAGARVSAVLSAWPAFVALAVYAVMRLGSGAFGPGDAPPYYQFTFAPSQIARNVLEYLDRGATVATIVVLVLAGAARRLRPIESSERRAILFGATWFAAWYLLTVFLPVRSSLYALVPSMGSALAAGAIADAVRRHVPRAFVRACTVLLVLACLAIPIHRSRNAQWVERAELSGRVIDRLAQAATAHPEGGTIMLIDDPSTRGLQRAFGTLFSDAVALGVGPQWHGVLAAGTPEQDTVKDVRLLFQLKGETLVSLP